ncbi:hypothetical protein RN001_013184 [Aquatica leii]|uniref:Uncharacterized protein n=1 Tax=Aquatica leii TaxID=1421715 RepID=A0AAN7SDQ1_9COLE|nr:hypothetical protein RN001_013184 [Aquatica leii]
MRNTVFSCFIFLVIMQIAYGKPVYTYGNKVQQKKRPPMDVIRRDIANGSKQISNTFSSMWDDFTYALTVSIPSAFTSF